METELESYLGWLRAGGAAFEVDADLARDRDHDGPLVAGEETVRALAVEDLPPVVEHRDPAAGLTADHATRSVAAEILRRAFVVPEQPFWDIGCGTGVLASLGALLGAAPVLGVDLDPAALALAARTAEETGVEVTLLQGSLLEPIPEDEEAGLVVANLPHRPDPGTEAQDLAHSGGPGGDAVFAAFAGQAERRLPPGARVLFFLHSLPHPRLLARLAGGFDLHLLSWKRRFLQPGEFGAPEGWLRERVRSGTSWLGSAGGREFLLAGVWEAVRK